MTFLLKAGAAFGAAAFLAGAVHLDAPRWDAVAAEIHAAHPRTVLDAQLRRLFAAGPERV
jgi:hypothetical protein